jgi:hypothetical protein
MLKSASPKIKPLLPLLLILSAFIISMPFISTYTAHAEGPPGLPHQFYGTVSSSGSIMGAGVTVTAKIAGSQVAASTTDSQGRYGYSTPMQVTGSSGQTIEFYVNGALASPTAVCNPGTVTPLNLSTGTAPPAGSCGITTASLPAGTVGTAYSTSIAASGGTTPYTWSVTSGTLPAGLSINSTNGMVSGTPTTAQTYSFTIQANDSASHLCSRTFSILVSSAAPAATVVSVSSSILGSADTFSLSNSVLSTTKDLASSDGRVRLSLPASVTINMQGLTQLGAATESNPPSAADNSTLIRAYSFIPSGATFSPAATMTLKYETASLPSGASESGLYIAFWNGTAWEKLTSTVNTSTKEVSAQVTHFTIFAIRYLPPATTTTATTTTTPAPATTTTTPATISTNVLGTTSSFSTSGGTVPAAASFSSASGKMGISLAANTALSLPAGSQQITVIQLATTPAPPANSKVIEAYAFGPDNTTFSPAASVTVKYDPAGLPADVQESNLYLALLENSNWTEVPSTVNTQAKTVTAQVSHFSTYALLGRVTADTTTPVPSTTPAATTVAPSAFSTSDLAVSPVSVKTGEAVTVSVRVVNGGTSEATKTVVLKINDQVESQKDVKLVPGKSQVVSFNVVRADPGQYRVSVDGQSASFSVTAAAGNEAPSGMSIPILAIIVAGGLLVIVLAIILVMRQRSSGY